MSKKKSIPPSESVASSPSAKNKAALKDDERLLAREKARNEARDVAKKILNFRGSTRFKPDPLTVAYLRLSEGSPIKKSKPNESWDLVGLVSNESFTGCALIVIQDELIQEKTIIVKVGALAPMPAKIVWQKQLEENIYKIGLQFES